MTLWHPPILPSPVRPVSHLVHEKGLPMSLVEDVLHLLHIVLDYFGVNPDMVSAHAPIRNPIKLTCKMTKLFVRVTKLDFLCVFLLYSWFQCGTVSCADSTAALCAWLGLTSRWLPPRVSTFRLVCRLCSVTGWTISQKNSSVNILTTTTWGSVVKLYICLCLFRIASGNQTIKYFGFFFNNNNNY